jgi:hypothetical protein
MYIPVDTGFDLTDQRSIRAGYRHHLAGLNDMGGLAVIGIGAGGDAQTSHHDAGNKRYNHDLEVRTAVC